MGHTIGVSDGAPCSIGVLSANVADQQANRERHVRERLDKIKNPEPINGNLPVTAAEAEKPRSTEMKKIKVGLGSGHKSLMVTLRNSHALRMGGVKVYHYDPQTQELRLDKSPELHPFGKVYDHVRMGRVRVASIPRDLLPEGFPKFSRVDVDARMGADDELIISLAGLELKPPKRRLKGVGADRRYQRPVQQQLALPAPETFHGEPGHNPQPLPEATMPSEFPGKQLREMVDEINRLVGDSPDVQLIVSPEGKLRVRWTSVVEYGG